MTYIPEKNTKWLTSKGEGLVERVEPDGSGWDVRLFVPVPSQVSKDGMIYRVYVRNTEWHETRLQG
jgi:hypothetical protein